MAERASKEEVLTWMAANRAGLKRASKQFNIPAATIAVWVRKHRDAAAGTPGIRQAHPPNLTVIQTPPPAPKAVMSRTMQTRARGIIKLAFDRLEAVIPSSDAKECATVITTLTDRFDLFGAKLRGGKPKPLEVDDGVDVAAEVARRRREAKDVG